MWALVSLFYLYETFLRVSPSVMTHELMHDFGVNSASLGVLSSFYYYAYVVLQIPCGMIVDKVGIRRIVTVSALLCVAGTFLFAESQTLGLAKLGRFMIGAGSACAFISCLKVTTQWFNPIHFSLVAGLTNMMGTVGGMCAGRPLALFVHEAGWRQTSFWLAIIGLGVAAISWIWLKDHPENKEHRQKTNERPFLEGLTFLAGKRSVWLIGLAGSLMYLPISAFAELWSVPFLMHAYDIDSKLASTASVMIFLGMAFGGPLAAYLVKHVRSIVRTMQLSAIMTAISFVLIAYTAILPFWFSFIILFMAGLCIGGQVLCFTLARNNCPIDFSGTAIGFTNALVMMSGIVFQPLLGHILDVFWDGVISDAGLPFYSTHAYQMSILTVPICLVLSIFVLHFIKNDQEN